MNTPPGVICVDNTHAKFESVKEAMIKAGLRLTPRDRSAVLVWYDTLSDNERIFAIKPWQIINRIPRINVLCRKVPLAFLFQRMTREFPDLYNFLPQSFILPRQIRDFMQTRQMNPDKTYIIKPNGGSLGKGIVILEPGDRYPKESDRKTIENGELAVAQEYIHSYLLDNTKFDLRIYVLVASLSPLRIYVYEDGLARFCSEPANTKSIYSRLTNVTLNKQNPNLRRIWRISRLITETFAILEEKGVDINRLWKKIDKTILLSLFSCYGHLVKAESELCPFAGYSRCFQILGYDILLGEDLNPHILEINYRPSLEFYRPIERRMKAAMIRDAILLGAPMNEVQNIIKSRKWGWGRGAWYSFLSQHPGLATKIEQSRTEVEKESGFRRIWPSQDLEIKALKVVLKRSYEMAETGQLNVDPNDIAKQL